MQRTERKWIKIGCRELYGSKTYKYEKIIILVVGLFVCLFVVVHDDGDGGGGGGDDDDDDGGGDNNQQQSKYFSSCMAHIHDALQYTCNVLTLLL
jgi:hypothetical protein